MSERVVNDPVTSPETEYFWTSANEGRFMVKHCTVCGKAHWYPRSMCPFCASMATEWREGTGTGEIYTFSVMRRAKEVFVMAYVTLAEGPRMMTNIVGCDPDTLRIGDRVRLVFVQSEGGFQVPCFEPAA